MSIKKIISSYAAYSLSANQQFVKWLNNQSEAQLQKDVPSSFNSVLQTLNHIWAIKQVSNYYRKSKSINQPSIS
jgi:uncharacterized damage-inducible protein DinB